MTRTAPLDRTRRAIANPVRAAGFAVDLALVSAAGEWRERLLRAREHLGAAARELGTELAAPAFREERSGD